MSIPHSRPWITEDDVTAVGTVLYSGMVAQGARAEEFEEAVATYLGASFAVSTGSGTAALTLGLHALGIAAGDEVIVPTYVCRNVLEAVVAVGATPVLCDIGEEWVMTAETVSPHITPRTAAIIAVHIFGLPVDVHALAKLGVPVVEDACQALGLTLDGRAAGTLGTVGALSFHPTKCLTSGEGGMLITSDARLATAARIFRDGTSSTPRRVASPLSDLQAALGLAQLRRYHQFLERRCQLRCRYSEALAQCRNIEWVPASSRAMFRLPVRLRGDFDRVREALSARGVEVRRGVDDLLHRGRGREDEYFPNASRSYRETLSIPFYPSLSDSECGHVIDAIVATLG